MLEVVAKDKRKRTTRTREENFVKIAQTEHVKPNARKNAQRYFFPTFTFDPARFE